MPEDSRPFRNLKTLQIWDMPDFTDAYSKGLSSWCSRITSLSIRGSSKVTGEGIFMLLNTLQIESLTIDRDTKIETPLSLLLDARTTSPLQELHVLNYKLSELFSTFTLNSIVDDSHKMPNTTIVTLNLQCPLRNVTALSYSSAVIFQALFWFLPALQTLRLDHQFPGNVQTEVLLPNSAASLTCVSLCRRHDSVRFIGVGNKVVRLVDCNPLADEKDEMERFDYNDDSSSSDSMDIHNLFD